MITTGFIGCASSQQSFKPAEKVGGETAEGFKEAFYDLAADNNVRFGEVKVWSRGATMGESEGMEVTLLHVGFMVENKGDAPIVFDTEDVELESVQTDDRTLEHVAASERMGPNVIQPRSSSDVELTFVLPRDVKPDRIRAFRVKWTTRTNGAEYTEFTPFVQQHEQRYAYVPVYSYYYPYYPYDYPYYGPFYYPRMHVVIVKPYPRRVIVRSHRGRR